MIKSRGLDGVDPEVAQRLLSAASAPFWKTWVEHATPAMQVALDGALEGRNRRPHHMGYTWLGPEGFPPGMGYDTVLDNAQWGVRILVRHGGYWGGGSVFHSHETTALRVLQWISLKFPDLAALHQAARSGNRRSRTVREAQDAWYTRDTDPLVREVKRVLNGAIEIAFPLQEEKTPLQTFSEEVYRVMVPGWEPPTLHAGGRLQMTWELLAHLKGDSAPLEAFLGDTGKQLGKWKEYA